MQQSESISIANAITVDTTGNPYWTFPLHSHAHHLEISLVQAGTGTLYYNGRSYAMRAGDVIVKNSGIIHAEQVASETPMRQIYISFAGVKDASGHPNQLLPVHMSPVLPSEAYFSILSPLFTYLAAHWQEEARSVICLPMMETILGIIEELITCRQKPNAKGMPDRRASETVAHVANWLNEHYMQKIALNELAEMFYISPYYLDRKFKACIGYSINQYIIDRRMGEAQRMLIFEEKSIKEIALAVGYSNLQYFYATFKKYTGKSPSVFRTEFRNR